MMSRVLFHSNTNDVTSFVPLKYKWRHKFCSPFPFQIQMTSQVRISLSFSKTSHVSLFSAYGRSTWPNPWLSRHDEEGRRVQHRPPHLQRRRWRRRRSNIHIQGKRNRICQNISNVITLVAKKLILRLVDDPLKSFFFIGPKEFFCFSLLS